MHSSNIDIRKTEENIMSNTTDNTIDPISALKKYFNYDSFRPGQESIVKRILAGEDLFVIMPTSAGKSLCFQLPILMKAGYGMVISPLISLMKDQVDKLHAKKIPAAFINSLLTTEEQQDVMNSISEGKLKILYVAPERLGSTSFLSFLENCPPSMLIVDEAHGISQYGHDFRPAYLRIGEAMRRLPGIQTCAFTATVTPVAREDVKIHLLRPDMKVIVTGFSRPNLSFSVVRCDSVAGYHPSTAARRLEQPDARVHQTSLF